MRKDERMTRSLAELALKGLRGRILVQIRECDDSTNPRKSCSFKMSWN